MSITAVVEQDTVKLPVHVPDGTRVQVLLPPDTSGAETRIVAPLSGDPFYRLAELAEPMGGLTNENIDSVIDGR